MAPRTSRSFAAECSAVAGRLAGVARITPVEHNARLSAATVPQPAAPGEPTVAPGARSGDVGSSGQSNEGDLS